MDAVWVKFLTLLLGIGIIAVGLLKPKENHLDEDKMEKIIEDFTLQLTLENEEFIRKIKDSQDLFAIGVNKKINQMEQKIEELEKIRLSQKQLPTMNPKYQEVLRLYQEGKNSHQIAQKINMGQGEVELVIELMKKGFAYA